MGIEGGEVDVKSKSRDSARRMDNKMARVSANITFYSERAKESKYSELGIYKTKWSDSCQKF